MRYLIPPTERVTAMAGDWIHQDYGERNSCPEMKWHLFNGDLRKRPHWDHVKLVMACGVDVNAPYFIASPTLPSSDVCKRCLRHLGRMASFDLEALRAA